MEGILYINRYIVECKVLDYTEWTRRSSDINRYIVECKASCYRFYKEKRNDINRYIVECKACVFSVVVRYQNILIDT